jgi:hypothetical protein
MGWKQDFQSEGPLACARVSKVHQTEGDAPTAAVGGMHGVGSKTAKRGAGTLALHAHE